MSPIQPPHRQFPEEALPTQEQEPTLTLEDLEPTPAMATQTPNRTAEQVANLIGQLQQ